MYMRVYIFMNMNAYMLLRSTTQYYVVLVLGSTSTSTTTVAASTVGYGGNHTMGVGGVFPVFTLLGNPLHMDLRNAYLYSLSLHFTV